MVRQPVRSTDTGQIESGNRILPNAGGVESDMGDPRPLGGVDDLGDLAEFEVFVTTHEDDRPGNVQEQPA